MLHNNASEHQSSPSTFLLLLCLTTLFLGADKPPVKKASLANSEPVPVVLFPWRKAVLSAEVTARVISIHKRMGENFKQGEILVELDPTMYRARKEQAEADLKATSKELEAVKKLFANRSRSQLDVVRCERSLAQARANLKMATHDLEACTIRAPFGGRVIKTMPEEFELVQRGNPLIAVINDSRLRARILMPAYVFKNIHIGASLEFLIRETGSIVTGKVTNISPAIEPGSCTFEVFAEIPNPKGLLRSGMRGKLRLHTPDPDNERKPVSK